MNSITDTPGQRATSTVAANVTVKLTEYSHGSGCGCKIAPKMLQDILQSHIQAVPDARLLVGHDTNDDAAVYDLGNGSAVVSTTDFFMPIVDDPFEFGQIAATNAISDVYAMGGTPLLAISIFGWPIDKLGVDVANRVIQGGRHTCSLAGIPLAGGHSIDAPEPIFGLAVTGLVDHRHLKRNNQARADDKLFLTKPLGIGILTTAQKRKLLNPEHGRLVTDIMCQLNSAGAAFGKLSGVTAMTDVTGFGLSGHLLEMCEASGVSARIDYHAVPLLPELEHYLGLECSPGGANRNYASYGDKLGPMTEIQRRILCDPQTSGGLLVAVRPGFVNEFNSACHAIGLALNPIGELIKRSDANNQAVIISLQ